VRFVAGEEQHLARFEVTGAVPGGEGDPAFQALHRDLSGDPARQLTRLDAAVSFIAWNPRS
jgi:hypothetical protein